MRINRYYRNHSSEIRNSRYIDAIKAVDNIRFLVLNPRGINPWNNYKCEMLINACKDFQVDIALLNETNIK